MTENSESGGGSATPAETSTRPQEASEGQLPAKAETPTGPDERIDQPLEPLEGELLEAAEELAGILAIHASQETYIGILPHPDHFRTYDEILPGAAERVMTLVEREQETVRQIMTKESDRMDRSLDAQIANQRRGQTFAFVSVLLGLTVATMLVYLGFSTAGIALVLGELTLIAGVFVTSRVSSARAGRRTPELEEPKGD